MGNGKELLYQAVSTILFCIAISLFFRQAASYQQLVARVKEAYQDSDALYCAEYNASDYVSYAELVITLCKTLEYDVEINGELISKYDQTVDKIDSYGIANTDYQKAYAYDTNGNVTRIIYTSISGG